MQKNGKENVSVYVDFAVRRGIVLSIALVLFFNLFFYRLFWSSGIAAILTSLWVYVYLLLGEKKKKIKEVITGTGLVVLGSVIQILFVGDWVKTTVLTMLSMAAVFVFYYSGLVGRVFGGLFELIAILPRLAGGYVGGMINAVLMTISNLVESKDKVKTVKQQQEQGGSFRSIMIGVVVGVPIVILLVLLLSQGDPVFADFVHNLLRFEIKGEVWTRTILSGALFLALIPVIFAKIERKFVGPGMLIDKRVWTSEVNTIVVMVVIVLGIFLAVQWPYVFASVAKETDLSRFGIATYSEYVTRGFGELLAVVGLLWGVSWMAILTYPSTTRKMQRVLQILHTVMGAELVVFIASIFRRVWLYQQYHGQTLARIYGLAFLIWLSGMLIMQAIRYVRRSGVVMYEILWSLVVIFGIIWVNPERIVISNPPTVNNKVDYLYLASLSLDGYDGWVSAYSWAKGTLEKLEQSKEVLDLEARRNVWYAGWVINTLSERYTWPGLGGRSGVWSWNYTYERYAERLQSEIPKSELDRLNVVSNNLKSRINNQYQSEQYVDFDREVRWH